MVLRTRTLNAQTHGLKAGLDSRSVLCRTVVTMDIHTTTMDHRRRHLVNKTARKHHRNTKTRKKEKLAHRRTSLKQAHPAPDQTLDVQAAAAGLADVGVVDGALVAADTGAAVVASRWEASAIGRTCSKNKCSAKTPTRRRE